jgi:hypothetical protein
MPVDPSHLNAVGDLVVTEPEALRVLADPVTLRLFDLVRRRGPVGARELALELGDGEAETVARLNAMASADLVDVDRDAPQVLWSTPARGLYFEIPDDGEEAQRAARALSSVMFVGASELPRRWVEEGEPSLSAEWARAAGVFNARMHLTPDEVRGLQDSLERLLEPFTTREESVLPPGTSTVRILAFFMPEPPIPGRSS